MLEIKSNLIVISIGRKRCCKELEGRDHTNVEAAWGPPPPECRRHPPRSLSSGVPLVCGVFDGVRDMGVRREMDDR